METVNLTAEHTGTTADQVRLVVESAQRYLDENYGHLASAGSPDWSKTLKVWRVPIYCSTEFGSLRAAEMELTSEGHVKYAPDRESAGRIVEETCERLRISPSQSVEEAMRNPDAMYDTPTRAWRFTELATRAMRTDPDKSQLLTDQRGS